LVSLNCHPFKQDRAPNICFNDIDETCGLALGDGFELFNPMENQYTNSSVFEEAGWRMRHPCPAC